MKIFVSSTHNDLTSYLSAAVRAFGNMGQHPGQIEIFNINPNESVEVALNELKQCEIFVGIYAHRYGIISSGKKRSITEIEYDYAGEIGLPRFCFLIEEDLPWNPNMIEQGKKAKLTNFKNKIKKDLIVEYFTTPEDLASKLAISVGRLISTTLDIVREKKEQLNKHVMKSELQPPFKAYLGDEPYLFASYAHADKELVYPIIEKLYKKKARIWYDEGIPASSNWIEEIAEKIINCTCFLVFFTPRSLNSKHVRDEINFAIRKDKKMLIVYLDDTELPIDIDFQIGSIQALFKHKMTNIAFWSKFENELDDVISEHLGEPAEFNLIVTEKEKLIEKRSALKAILKKNEANYEQGLVTDVEYFKTFKKRQKEMYLIENKIKNFEQELDEAIYKDYYT